VNQPVNDRSPSGSSGAWPGHRRRFPRDRRQHTWQSRLLVCLACLSLVLAGASPAGWERQVDGIARPFRFSYLTWHLRRYAELFHPVRVPARAQRDPAGYVISYFGRVAQARALAETPGGVSPEEQDALTGMGPVVERILAGQVREAYRDQGIYGPADRFVRVPVTFPPVWFALEAPPHLLVISPRTEIASLRQQLLDQSMDLATMENIEREVETLDLSALVTEIGGLGATYPSVVSDDSSLRYTIDTVAEEWLHQYLTFTPLGWRYVLHLLGLREDYAVAQINESLAGIVNGDIGDAVWERYYAGLTAPAAPAATEPDPFDYRAFMRETRVRADELLAEGAVREAEDWMESRRQIAVAEGYRIRKLNQAYFAFYGTYADAPGSTTPIGDELRALRGASPSLSAYLNMAVRIRTHDDLRELLQDRGVGTTQLAPAR
jgi:hypothetical protein